jgi:ATP-dependent Zn protease
MALVLFKFLLAVLQRCVAYTEFCKNQAISTDSFMNLNNRRATKCCSEKSEVTFTEYASFREMFQMRIKGL